MAAITPPTKTRPKSGRDASERLAAFPRKQWPQSSECACGRARWKIENETFNVLKNNGYHLEHNFGHGKENLSALPATLNLFAFACHGLCESLETACEKARDILGSRQRFFEHLRTITSYLVFPSWSALVRTLRTGQPPPARASP